MTKGQPLSRARRAAAPAQPPACVAFRVRRLSKITRAPCRNEMAVRGHPFPRDTVGHHLEGLLLKKAPLRRFAAVWILDGAFLFGTREPPPHWDSKGQQMWGRQMFRAEECRAKAEQCDEKASAEDIAIVPLRGAPPGEGSRLISS